MGRMGMMIDLKENKVKVEALGGIEVKLREDEQGHLRLPILRRKREELLLEGWKEKAKKKLKELL